MRKREREKEGRVEEQGRGKEGEGRKRKGGREKGKEGCVRVWYVCVCEGVCGMWRRRYPHLPVLFASIPVVGHDRTQPCKLPLGTTV